MQKKTFAAKEIIFRENGESDAAYFILSGKVEILKTGTNGEVKLAVLEPGTMFGEMSLIDGTPHSASARALDDTEVELISREQMDSMISSTPPMLNRMIGAWLDRLRRTNQRVIKAEQATILLETDITTLHISPGSDRLSNLIQPSAVPVARLPYRIGGYAEDGEPSRYDQNHLYIASEGPPLVVSRNHCAIEIDEGKIVFLDRGSRFGSFVNGQQIGRGRGVYKAPLAIGINNIVLGTKAAEYCIQITCE